MSHSTLRVKRATFTFLKINQSAKNGLFWRVFENLWLCDFIGDFHTLCIIVIYVMEYLACGHIGLALHLFSHEKIASKLTT